jgi:hypothetical protein
VRTSRMSTGGTRHMLAPGQSRVASDYLQVQAL